MGNLIEQKGYRMQLQNIHSDTLMQDNLIRNGYLTPFHIAAKSERQFIADFRGRMNLDKDEARKIYRRAQKIKQKAMHLYMNLKTTIGSPFYQSLRGKTVGDDLGAEFADIPGYQELFGSLDYVKGASWKSIFGLAAYFVDIMRITDRYISEPNKGTIPQDMKLKDRRPDLWALPIDEMHTDALVPYLQIVIERLYGMAVRQMGTDDPYGKMAVIHYPFGFPVSLPLEQIRIDLKQAGVTLDRIYECASADKEAAALERLQVSWDILEDLSRPLAGDRLAEYFGTDIKGLDSLSQGDHFVKAAGITMEELTSLLYQDLTAEDMAQAAGFFINRGLAGESCMYLQGKTIVNCNQDALERMNRLIRASRMFRLEFAQTDWMLRCLSADGDMDEVFFRNAVKGLDTYRLFSIDFDAFFGLSGQIKTYGQNCAFDRIFNKGSRKYHPKGAWNTGYQDELILWRREADTDVSSWLAGSMTLSMNQLYAAASYLFPEGDIELSIENLSLMYGHVAVSKSLSLSIEDYLALHGAVCSGRKLTMESLSTLHGAAGLLKQFSISMYDVEFLLHGSASPYVTLRYDEDGIEELSKYIWNSMGNAAALQGSEETQGREDAQSRNLVTGALADYFQTSQEVIDGLEGFFPAQEGLKAWYMAFLVQPQIPGEPSPYLDYIRGIMLTINKWLNVLEDGIPLDLVRSIGKNKEIYGFQGTGELTLDNWLSIYCFNNLFALFGDSGHKLLGCILLDEAGIKMLSSITSWEEGQIKKMLPVMEEDITKKIYGLNRYFTSMNLLGADTEFMDKLLGIKDIRTEEYGRMQEIAQDVENSIVSGEDGSDGRAALSVKRDRLLKILLWNLDMSEEGLYKYLLIDVKMDEKTEISYIREGINALQLYLQQCRMGLEAGIQYLDIEESWWPWVQDYNMWEANRKNYVYPENYLIPSVRHTKTEQFMEVESGLQQSNITKEYVEGLTGQYLEKILDTMEVRILAACERDGTTYLFGRTKKEPYKFYYCFRKNTPVFGQWKEMEGCSITSGQISPAVIFGKLYVFWAELKSIPKSMISGTVSIEGVSYLLDVKYTYLNSRKQWVTPQSLISDELVYYEENGQNPVNDLKLFKGLYRMTDPVWNRISVIPVSGKNYEPFAEKDFSSEKMLLIYGPPLNGTAEETAEDFQFNSIAGEGGIFARQTADKIHAANLLKKAGGNGYLPAGVIKAFNYNLQEDFLVRKNEFIVMDEYSSQKKSGYITPVLNRLGGSFGVTLSPDMLLDMFSSTKMVLNDKGQTITGESFIMDGISQEASAKIFELLREKGIIDKNSMYSPLTVQRDRLLECDLKEILLDGDSSPVGDRPALVKEIETVLFKNIPGIGLLPASISSDANVIPVSNCPGQFIIDNVEEVFLFTAVKDDERKQCPDITSGLTVSYPLFDACVLRTGKSVNKADACPIIHALTGNGMLDSNHIAVLKNCTIGRIENALQDYSVDCLEVYSLLQNDPIVDDKIFVSESLGIEKELSGEIFRLFEKDGIIVGSRARLDVLFQTRPDILFQDLIVAGKISYGQIDGIYDCLLHAPAPVSVKYWNDAAVEADKAEYTIMRLSSGASSSLASKMQGGLDSLLDINSQNNPVISSLPFSRYQVQANAPFQKPKAQDAAAVDFEGLYGEYFWELFFHIPMLTAENLRDGFQNELGKSWYEYVFNPINKERFIENTTFSDLAPEYISVSQSQKAFAALVEQKVIDQSGRVLEGFSRDMSCLEDIMTEKAAGAVLNILDNFLYVPSNSYYWNFFPFHNYSLDKMLDVLDDRNPAMALYNDDPYNPHAIARIRLGSYEKYVMMQYIGNLIAWGDQNFVQNSWEALTRASMLYTMASQLLGRPPEMIGVSKDKETVSFSDIEKEYEIIPQFLIQLASMCGSSDDQAVMGADISYIDDSTYFSVPENEELAGYWGLVEDRLYKVRNSLDINGNPRSIPLYGTPLDPLALAKSAYSSQGMMSANGHQPATVYPYRFRFMAELAKGLIGSLMSMGSQMLAILEKKDAEQYAALTSGNEKILMDMTTQIKKSQIRELEENLKSLQTSREAAEYRLDYYDTLIEEDLSEAERESLAASDTAFALSTAASVMKMSAGAAHALPQLGSPFAMTYGGVQVGSMLNSISSGMEMGASIASFIGQRSQTMAGYQRRKKEWMLQKELIDFEIQGLESQRESSQLKLQAANEDLSLHEKAVAQKEGLLQFLKDKFTGQQLYQWMQGRMNTLMWQSYQLALEVSLGAQAAFQYERDSDKTFLTYEYYDSQKFGLLTGENMLLSLEQMQNEYYRQGERRLEVEKHVSLAMQSPESFLRLKSEGSCSFELTEAMFDYDYPGMYARKIISVSVSIPAVIGPYQSINAMLTQTKNKILVSPDKEGLQYLLEHQTGQMPKSIRADMRSSQRIALSKGIDDSGLIRLDFSDEKYLPFEGTGAVSGWRLDMPKNTNQFHFDSIADVIIHVKYTAKMDGKFQDTVTDMLNHYPREGSTYYSLKQNFPGEWNTFLNQKKQVQELKFFFKWSNSFVNTPALKGIWFKFDFSMENGPEETYSIMDIQLPGMDVISCQTSKGISQAVLDCSMESLTGEWAIRLDTAKIYQYPGLRYLLKDGCLDGECFRNIEMILVYEGSFV